ncbi:MAG: response regulator [Anaerolineaceae bacterium]|nr:response regulator [Anaerolineaceae bacterium]
MSQPRKSIVIVDDTPENLRLLGQMLNEQGYRVRSAPNGEHALASIRKERPDLILLDILMPDMNGYEVCQQLKSDAQLNDIPVIFISALNEVFDKVTAFSIGAVDYITKPFQIEEVLARVRTHLSLEEMRQTLDLQNRQLQEQNHELEAFAHTVAHDLKNPLSTILGGLELMQHLATDLDEDSERSLDISLNGAHKMHSIIEELLLLASIRKEAVQTSVLDMAKVVDQVMYRLSGIIDKYHAEIMFPETWPEVMGYEPWVEEVWVNYLTNGLKYGGEPPYLELGAQLLADNHVRFYVRDNGRGLTPEAQASLFTEFTRLDKVRAQGHGLGLSIVGRIMSKLDGQCGVESAVGEGSLFYFTLPTGD